MTTFAQKWAFVTQGVRNNVYISNVIDLTKLNCSGTSDHNEYGYKRDQADIYKACASEWFHSRLVQLNYVPDSREYIVNVSMSESYGYGGFYKTREEAEKARTEKINQIRYSHDIPVEVN